MAGEINQKLTFAGWKTKTVKIKYVHTIQQQQQ